MARPKLFQYAVIWHPTEKQIKDEDKKSEVVVTPTIVLANDDKQAGMIAVMAIPEKYKTQLDQLDIAVRAF